LHPLSSVLNAFQQLLCHLVLGRPTCLIPLKLIHSLHPIIILSILIRRLIHFSGGVSTIVWVFW
jgi:hypothetical protein